MPWLRIEPGLFDLEDLEEMPGKLTKNRKIHKAQRAHATKVLASVEEVFTEYDGSQNAKDGIAQLKITPNEKLATLKALNEHILTAVDEGEIENETKESDKFSAKIHKVLVRLQSCEVVHEQQENLPSQVTAEQVTSVSGNTCKSKLPKLNLNKFNGDPKHWLAQQWRHFDCRGIHLFEKFSGR